jgi:hypothetical protein
MNRFIRFGLLEGELRIGVFIDWEFKMVGADFGFFYAVVGDCRI